MGWRLRGFRQARLHPIPNPNVHIGRKLLHIAAVCTQPIEKTLKKQSPHGQVPLNRPRERKRAGQPERKRRNVRCGKPRVGCVRIRPRFRLRPTVNDQFIVKNALRKSGLVRVSRFHRFMSRVRLLLLLWERLNPKALEIHLAFPWWSLQQIQDRNIKSRCIINLIIYRHRRCREKMAVSNGRTKRNATVALPMWLVCAKYLRKFWMKTKNALDTFFFDDNLAAEN